MTASGVGLMNAIEKKVNEKIGGIFSLVFGLIKEFPPISVVTYL